jgi:Lon protease-like protein
MMGMNALESAVERPKARGQIPVFPLPNVVLFPHVSLGLHIFEPRYRRMIEDALASDRLIAMALLKEGWEQDYDGSPPVHDIACAGVIEEHQRLPDARFNIRLRGLSRIALGAFTATAPYRVAAFRSLDDLNADDGPAVRPYRERLLLTCAGLLRDIAGPSARPLALSPDLPFTVGVNSLCQSLSADAGRRQALLETDDVIERCRSLLEILTDLWKDAAVRQEEPGLLH